MNIVICNFCTVVSTDLPEGGRAGGLGWPTSIGVAREAQHEVGLAVLLLLLRLLRGDGGDGASIAPTDRQPLLVGAAGGSCRGRGGV